MNRTLISILKILNRCQDTVIGSREISRQLKMHGVNLSERTVRYHLKILDERRLTESFGKEGRKITDKGREEFSNAFVSDKVGFVINRIDTLSYLSSFDLDSQNGEVILNVSYIHKRDLKSALTIMRPVFSSPYVMSDRVVILNGGQRLGEIIVPEGRIAIGTICSVTINGLFLKAGIPVTSRFGGVLEIGDNGPSRFVSLISYDGSSLDPHELFIRSKMTDIKGAIKNREGRILASFREIPIVCLEKARGLSETMEEKGIQGILTIGEPNTSLYESSVGMDRAGMVVVGGLNPIAILEENGIPVESKAMSTLYEYSSLKSFQAVCSEFIHA